MAIARGTRIDRYEVLSLLGKGGMGEVYLAHDAQLKRKVALKLLPEQSTQDTDRVRRFEQEAQAASALNHPSIITIYEMGRANGAYYLATEFIEGETLRERLKRGRLSVPEALDIAIQMGGALVQAHGANIVHRDIKPENVMLRPDGLVKILDFGLAKLTERQAASDSNDAQTRTLQVTSPGMIVGTVTYMSPEQARGQPLDGRTDVFSLGVVLYEMIAGANPFGGDSQADILARILERDPAPFSQQAGVPPELEGIVSKALRKNRDARYSSAKELLADLTKLKHTLELGTGTAHPITGRIAWRTPAVALALVLIVLATAVFFYLKRQPLLTEHDTILLADFTNSTGDAVFDGALQQGLAVQLEQSPFLDILPDARARQTLRLMQRSPEERITREVARDICQRQGLKAFIAGSIAPLGSHYVIGLEAVNSQSGDVIAREQVEVVSKEEVLKGLTSASKQLRRQLGESLGSVQKFDAPLALTTSSLEALKAYSLGWQESLTGRFLDAIPFMKHAVELDPYFAYAYAGLAANYNNTGQRALAAQNAAKAFDLRDRVTELEKFRITYYYYSNVTGERDQKAIEVLQLHQQSYPRDYRAPGNLASVYNGFGQYEKAVEAAREALRRNSPSAVTRINLAMALTGLGRLAEAKEVLEGAVLQKLDGMGVRRFLYAIAFINHDQSSLRQQLDWADGQAGGYESIGSWQAQSAAFAGQWRQSQDDFRRGIEMASRGNAVEVAARYAAEEALRAAAFGKCGNANAAVARALELEHGREALSRGAVALALCGQASHAQPLIDELSERFSKDTRVNAIWRRASRAALALAGGSAQAAIESLEPARQYEAGEDIDFWPQHIRALAYLRAKSSTQAAAEFQKILDHRGWAPLSALYPLAHVGLARAAALSGDRGKAVKEYEAFLELWKDADADLPILQEAKREYQKLQAGR